MLDPDLAHGVPSMHLT